MRTEALEQRSGNTQCLRGTCSGAHTRAKDAKIPRVRLVLGAAVLIRQRAIARRGAQRGGPAGSTHIISTSRFLRFLVFPKTVEHYWGLASDPRLWGKVPEHCDSLHGREGISRRAES